MPKLLEMIRSRKSSTMTSSAARTKKSRNDRSSVFRRGRANHRNSKSLGGDEQKKSPAIIVSTLTYTLSEDDEGNDIVRSPTSDIENQVQERNEQSTAEDTEMQAIETSTGNGREKIAARADDSDTMTFTHLEIMRNELAHMMQMAEKDKEIHLLRQANAAMASSHEQEMAMKEVDIAKIREALETVEAALSRAEEKLVTVNEEHSKCIEVLMKTQYDLFELKHSPSSWMTPVLSFFDFN